MLAAQLIQKIKSGEYELTDFARAVDKNDFKLEKSSTWWSIHLAICFSERNEPYASFFTSLENISKDWLKFDDIKNKIDSKIEDAAKGSLDPNLDGVLKMFKDDRPLEDLGLIETQGDSVRLGSPKLTDEIITHAISRMKFHCFKSRPSVSFSEVTQTGLAHFLCCSNDELRKHLRRMEQSNNWKLCFSFTEAVNVDSEPNTSASEKLYLDLAWLKGAHLIWKNDLTQQWTLLGDSGVNVEKLIEEKLNHFAGRSAETLLKNYPAMCDDLLPTSIRAFCVWHRAFL